MSPAQLREKEIDLGEQADSIVKGNIFLQILMPALTKVHQIAYRAKTEVGATQVIIAIIRYQKNKGTLPESLEQLKQAGFIKQIPLDSFSNRPLIYEKTNDGFKLYSVGLNFVDDGGQVHRDDKGKVRLWDDEEGDAVFWPVQK
jgi:competence protein ComGC